MVDIMMQIRKKDTVILTSSHPVLKTSYGTGREFRDMTNNRMATSDRQVQSLKLRFLFQTLNLYTSSYYITTYPDYPNSLGQRTKQNEFG